MHRSITDGHQTRPQQQIAAAPRAGYRPAAAGLSPLPAQFWRSWDVTRAVAGNAPGTVIALTRQAHGLSQAELGTLAGFSQSAISRLETGGNLGYDIRVLRSLGRLLGVPPRLLGLADDSPPAALESVRLPIVARLEELATESASALPGTAVDRRTLLDACVAAVVGAPTQEAWRLVDDGRVADPQTVHRLLVVRRLVNDADSWIGADGLAPAVAELYRLIDLMRRAASGGMRQWLLDVTALYAEFYGWLRQEVGDLRGAGEWTERSLQQAQAADDRELVAYAYVRKAQLAEADRDDDRVIGLSRAALREPGICAQVRALALQQEARGHAIAGNAAACLSKLDEARDLDLPDSAPWSDRYRVGYYFDANHLKIQHASCLLELGRVRDAIAFYEDHADSREHLCRWEQAVHVARLARAYALVGEPDRAAAIGTQALEMGTGTSSTLVVEELRKLDVWHAVPAIASLAAELDRLP